MIYVELSSRLYHDTKHCRRGECSGQCDWAQFHAELDSPLLPWEIDEARRIRERFQLLRSGEIPA